MSTNLSPLTQTVAANVRDLRIAAGLSAEQLAQKLGVVLGKEIQPYIVNRLEKGARPVTVEELGGLAVVLGVQPAELLDDAQSELRNEVAGLEADLRECIVQFVGARGRTERIATAIDSLFAGHPEMPGELADRLRAMVRVIDSVKSDGAAS